MIDIDINEISEALNDKADIDLDNTIPQCIDYIVEFWHEGTEWYKVYKSGWCEQGGRITTTTGSYMLVDLLKPFANNYYTINGNYIDNTASDANIRGCNIGNLTTTNFYIKIGLTGVGISWEAKGFIK